MDLFVRCPRLFSRCKAELLEGGAVANVEHARMEIFTYIESCCNQAPWCSAF